MSKLNLRTITNNFQDVRLVSLASWKQASEITPRDQGGPYVILQEGYSPQDMTMTSDEFILGRSGKWLALAMFYRMPVADRRAEFVFGTVAEVMQTMDKLPPKVAMLGAAAPKAEGAPVTAETDEMAAALEAAKSQEPDPAT